MGDDPKYAQDRLRDNDEEDHDEQPPNAASAAAAVAALQAELGLAEGNLDALDRKAALLPAFLAALAGLFIGSESVITGQLPDAVEHVRVRRQICLRGRFGQDPMAEAVKVANRDPGADGRTNGSLDARLELPRRLDVVGQDQGLFGHEVGLRVEEPLHALDDHSRLARAGARDHDGRPIAMLDDPPLLIGEREIGASGGSRRRYGDDASSLS